MYKQYKKMIIVGLTGGIGSGKSTVAKQMRLLKIPVFDSDNEVDKLYKKKKKDLISFVKKLDPNKEIIKNNKINKKKLGDVVFNNKKKLKDLENLIFKRLAKSRKKFLNKHKKRNEKIVVLDTPLLFENKINEICDFTILTKAPIKIRIKRALQRLGMTQKKLTNIITKQMKDKDKTKLADFIIMTNVKKQTTKNQLFKTIKQIKQTTKHL